MVGWVIGALWLAVYGLRFMVDGLGVWVQGLGFRGDFEGSLVSVIVERNTLVGENTLGKEYTRKRIHSGRNTLGREYTRERKHSGRNTLVGS